jgi:hypothetical protein
MSIDVQAGLIKIFLKTKKKWNTIRDLLNNKKIYQIAYHEFIKEAINSIEARQLSKRSNAIRVRKRPFERFENIESIKEESRPRRMGSTFSPLDEGSVFFSSFEAIIINDDILPPDNNSPSASSFVSHKRFMGAHNALKNMNTPTAVRMHFRLNNSDSRLHDARLCINTDANDFIRQHYGQLNSVKDCLNCWFNWCSFEEAALNRRCEWKFEINVFLTYLQM